MEEIMDTRTEIINTALKEITRLEDEVFKILGVTPEPEVLSRMHTGTSGILREMYEDAFAEGLDWLDKNKE